VLLTQDHEVGLWRIARDVYLLVKLLISMAIIIDGGGFYSHPGYQ
jgi:hypothetical protein